MNIAITRFTDSTETSSEPTRNAMIVKARADSPRRPSRARS